MSNIRDIIKFESKNYVKDGIKDKRRVSNHGEVYTPENVVNDMLDLTCNEPDDFHEYKRLNFDGTEEIRKRNLGNQLLIVDKTFLEPACGNGNFLVAIIERKLMRAVLDAKEDKSDIKFGVFKAFATTYGVDILADNVLEARQRMLEEIISNEELVILLDKESDEDIEKLVKSINFVLDKNIILGNFLTKTYVDDTSTRGRNKLNKGLKDQEIKIYNWKTGDEFDESGFIKLTWATLNDLEEEFPEDSEDSDKFYLDYKLNTRKRIKEEKETVEVKEDVSQETSNTSEKRKRRHREKVDTSDDGCIPDGL